MDAGAIAAWPVRYNDDELSAIQHAMNLRIDRPAAFAAEYQNDPTTEEVGEVSELTSGQLDAKRNNVPRGVVPRGCGRLTAFVDVGQKVLWWAVCGWDERFGGSVVDYGCWPRQNRSFFAAADARPTLADVYPNLAEEAVIYKGLADLTAAILGREWPQAETGASLRVDRCLIDSGWKPDVVYPFCRQSAFAPILLASKGYAVGPSGTPVDLWAVRPGERRGPGWRLGVPGGPSGRLLTYDPNHWKTFVADRLLTPFGPAGCMSVNGDKTTDHEMLFDHLTSEYRTRVSAKGRVWDAWAVRPERTDNHLLDCCVGAAVAASERGLVFSASGEVTPTQQSGRGPTPPPKKFSELQREKMAKRYS
jgi:phage terminase large subunit GpA-like protein